MTPPYNPIIETCSINCNLPIPKHKEIPAEFILPGLTVYFFLLAFAILRHMTMPKIIMAWDRP